MCIHGFSRMGRRTSKNAWPPLWRSYNSCIKNWSKLIKHWRMNTFLGSKRCRQEDNFPRWLLSFLEDSFSGFKHISLSPWSLGKMIPFALCIILQLGSTSFNHQLEMMMTIMIMIMLMLMMMLLLLLLLMIRFRLCFCGTRWVGTIWQGCNFSLPLT